ncbi:MAG: hypothetical protein PHQ74_06375 [Crocinitomicaceae bacterium]|nr:hypothetical protein [Crocinitomicaceae bacterium]
MTTLAQIFETGEQSSQKGHFRNLVLLSRLDGEITASEEKLLKRIAQRLSLTDEQVKEIKNNPERYHSIPPYDKEERISRLIHFFQIAMDDNVITAEEKVAIGRCATSLGFSDEYMTANFDTIQEHILKGKNKDEIMTLLMGE